MQAGDKVQWTETRQGKRTMSMRLRTGVVEAVGDKLTIVKLPGGHLALVDTPLLQPRGSRSTVTEFVEAMRESVVGQ